MIISPYLIAQFLAGTKTQHRIPVYPGDSLSWVEQRNGYALALPPDQPRLLRNGRLLYRVGGTYAIQPRGRQRAIAEVKILKITGEDVRTITQEEVEKEGYLIPTTFWSTWCYRHDPDLIPFFGIASKLGRVHDLINDRRPEAYQAWVLTWERVV